MTILYILAPLKSASISEVSRLGEGVVTRIAYVAICAVCLYASHSVAADRSHLSADDRICDYLLAYERAPFERDSVGHEKFRWIEVHWIGTWLDIDHGWHLECRRSPDNASNAFCSWLLNNTSFEFDNDLPLRILTCHGYRFSDWRGIYLSKAEAEFYREDTGQILLQINLEGHKQPDGAVRLTIFPKGKDQATENWWRPLIDESQNPVLPWPPWQALK
jgi:hypothetical protein